MENKHLVELEVKYGYTNDQVNKIVSICDQLEVKSFESDNFKSVTKFIFEKELIEFPSDEIITKIKDSKVV